MPGALTRRLYSRWRARDATPLRRARLGRRRGVGARRRRRSSTSSPSRGAPARARSGRRRAVTSRRRGRVAGRRRIAWTQADQPDATPTFASPNGGARRPARTLPAERVTRSCRLRAGSVPAVRGAPRGRADVLRRRPARPRLGDAAAARASPRRPARSPGARSSPTASSPPSPAARARRGRPARSAPTTASRSIIPCHRVVAANGIGGYGSAGLGLKRRLLALEGVHL